MKKDQDIIRRLFEKYLTGECTPEEKSAIMACFDRDVNEARIRELIREEFEKEIQVGEDSARTVGEVYRDFGWMPGRRRPFRRVFPAFIRPGVAAAWLGAVFCLALVFYLFNSKISPEEAMLTTVTAFGERKKVKLSDGSVVWLNAASRLGYPGRFSGDLREVTLEGEAFFDVARNPDKPFVIRSGTLKTTVLGTSFNIRAYEEDKTMSVAVVTGKVRVSSSGKELQLEPNQQAVFDKKRHKLDKKPEMAASEMASWKEGMLQFRNTTFSEVTAVLKRSRGVSIQYEPRLENCPIIHADFNGDDSLESILGTLMIAVNGSVEKTGDGGYFLRSSIDCHL